MINGAGNPLGLDSNIMNKAQLKNIDCDFLELWEPTTDLYYATGALAVRKHLYFGIVQLLV